MTLLPTIRTAIPPPNGCANHRERGTCDNPRTIARKALEERVLLGLREKLMAPEMVELFVQTYVQEANVLAAERSSEHRFIARELTSVRRKIGNLVAAIEDGQYAPSLGEKLQALEAREEQLAANLKTTPSLPEPVTIHPSIGGLYRKKVEALEEALHDSETVSLARDALRSLIEAIIIYPGEKRGQTRVELYGELASILRLCGIDDGSPKQNRSSVSGTAVSLVAGARFELTTFRL